MTPTPENNNDMDIHEQQDFADNYPTRNIEKSNNIMNDSSDDSEQDDDDSDDLLSIQ